MVTLDEREGGLSVPQVVSAMLCISRARGIGAVGSGPAQLASTRSSSQYACAVSSSSSTLGFIDSWFCDQEIHRAVHPA
jgi:hypothetical protein